MKRFLLGLVLAVGLSIGQGGSGATAQVPCDGYWYHPHYRFLYYVQEDDGSFSPYYVFWYWHVHSDAECWA